VVRNRQILQGRDGKKVRLNGLEGASDIIIIQGSEIIVRNLDFEMSKNVTANCIKFNNKSASIEKCTVSNISARNAGCVITDADSANMVITTTMEKIECYNNRGTAFKLNDFWGFIFFNDILIDNSSLKSDLPAVYVKDNAGLIVRGLTIKGGTAGSTGHGVHFHNSVAVWMADVDIDDAGGTGIMFTGSAEHFYIRNSKITNSGVFGIYSTGTFMQLHDIDVSDSGSNGIQIAGENFQLSKVRSERNNGHGIYCISLNYSSFSDITVNGNSKYGVFDEGGSNSFFNISGSGNTSGLANAHAISRLYNPGE
ncbi:MAG: right-handed parallel beta-helix repeat-containing protein, partial [Saccharofermentanales bacterium]